MNKNKTILVSGLLAGLLDAVAAVLLYVKIFNAHNIGVVFRYIASALFEEAMTAPGPLYPIIGVALHFIIAIIWAAIYVILIQPVFKPGALWAKILLYGSFVWVGMNGIVLTVASLTSRYSNASILKSYAAIAIAVAIPICLIAEQNLKRKKVA